MAKHFPEKALFLNMIMIEDGDQVLVENRRKPDWPGITFPGGHVEPNESFVASAVREAREETGLEITKLQLVGLCQYLDQSAEGVDFRRVIYFYRTQTFKGELKASREGEVYWMPRKKLREVQLGGGMSDFLTVFETPEISELIYLTDQMGHSTTQFN